MSDLPPYQRHSATSKEASEMIAPNVKSIKAKVLDALKEQPLTDNELIALFGGNANTIRPRRIELVRDGLVEQVGVILTSAKRHATVWRAK